MDKELEELYNSEQIILDKRKLDKRKYEEITEKLLVARRKIFKDSLPLMKELREECIKNKDLETSMSKELFILNNEDAKSIPTHDEEAERYNENEKIIKSEIVPEVIPGLLSSTYSGYSSYEDCEKYENYKNK